MTASDVARARLHEGDVPAELAGPGTIVQRQTTYWAVRAATGAVYRIHFRDKVETAFTGADYPGIERSTRHPLLVQYDEPSRALHFWGTPSQPRLLAESLERVIRDLSGGWRGLADYAGKLDDVERLLRAGYGLLMRAPESVCAAVAPVLEREGLGPSIVGGSSAHGAGKQVLLLGRSYVIASAFAYERAP